jgi:hypothetical protein
MTPGDETFEFWVHDLRLKPGMPVEKSWLLVLWSLISLEYQARQFLQRLKGCFCSPYWDHNVYAWFWWGMILTIVDLNRVWQYFFIAWLFPLSVLFEDCSVLRQGVEHRCPVPGDGRKTAFIRLADLPPLLSDDASRLKHYFKWTGWWTRFILIHLPSRLLVLPGDSPNHPLHHHDPGDKQLHEHIFKSSPPDAYPVNWGLINALNDTLVTWSLQIPTNAEINDDEQLSTTEALAQPSIAGDYLLQDYCHSKERLDSCLSSSNDDRPFSLPASKSQATEPEMPLGLILREIFHGEPGSNQQAD